MLEGNKKYNNKPTTEEELEPTSKKKEKQPTNLKAYEGTNLKKSYRMQRKGNRNEAKYYQTQTATRLILSNIGFSKVVVCENWGVVNLGIQAQVSF